MRLTVKRQIHKENGLEPAALRLAIYKRARRGGWPEGGKVEEVHIVGGELTSALIHLAPVRRLVVVALAHTCRDTGPPASDV